MKWYAVAREGETGVGDREGTREGGKREGGERKRSETKRHLVGFNEDSGRVRERYKLLNCRGQ